MCLLRMEWSLLYPLLLLLTFLLTLAVRYLAIRNGFFDIPNARSLHSEPTPIGGGLAVAISWYGLLIYMFYRREIDSNLFYALLSGSIVCIVSLIDDLVDLRPAIRILAQTVSAVAAVYFLGGLKLLDVGFATIELPLWSNILVIILFIWFINLFNFSDGIDGYLGAGGVFIFASMSFFTDNPLSLGFAAIITGFLLLNWPKAKIFSGDVGSTLIGFTFVVFAIKFQNENELSLINSLVLSGLFWTDVTVTLVRRMINRERLVEPHNKFAYHRLFLGGYSQQRVLLTGIGLNILLFLVVLIFLNYAYEFLPGALLVQTAIIWLFIKLADHKRSFYQS